MALVFPRVNPQIPDVTVYTRDEAHRQLVGPRISTNRYDAKFLGDIWMKYLSKDRQLSEGQNELWEKLIHKYRKQLKKQGINYKDILSLPWKNGIRSREEILTNSVLDIVSNNGKTEVVLSFYFNKHVIDELRAILHDDQGHFFKTLNNSHYFGNNHKAKYDFLWNSEAATWHGPYHPYLFRELYYFAKKHGLTIGPGADKLMSLLQGTYGDPDLWQVRAHVVHGRIYINNINENLHDALNKYNFNDISLAKVEKLCSRFGILPPSVIDECMQDMMRVTTWNSPVQVDADDARRLFDYFAATNKTAMIIGKAANDLLGQYDPDRKHVWVDAITVDHLDYFRSGQCNAVISYLSLDHVITTWHRAWDNIPMVKHIIINETGNNTNKR
jgi:hypothetical protein